MSLLPTAPLVITILTMGIILTACESSPAAAPTDNSSFPTPTSGTRVPESLAPSFSVSTGASSRFSSSEHRGEVVVLYFSFPG